MTREAHSLEEQCPASSARGVGSKPFGPKKHNQCILQDDGHTTHNDGFGQWFKLEPQVKILPHAPKKRKSSGRKNLLSPNSKTS